LIGGVKKETAWKLGIYLWTGGHEIIYDALAHKKTFRRHPEWYYMGPNRKREFFERSRASWHQNPCFTNIKLARHVANYIKQNPELNVAHFLNLWPADGASSKYCNCKDCRVVGNRTDQFLNFLKNIQIFLGESPIITGISYNSTWEAPSKTSYLQMPLNFMNIFYLSQRSYSDALFLPDSHIFNNNQYCKLWSDWLQSGKTQQYGVTEYFNKSYYGGLCPTFHRILKKDFQDYKKFGVVLFSYMHPIKRDPGPRRLTHYLMSKLLWNVEEDIEEILNCYFQNLFPFNPGEIKKFYDTMDKAQSNMVEMFASYVSLRKALFFGKGHYSEDELDTFYKNFKEGGIKDLPLFESQYLVNQKDAHVQSEFVGLTESLELQKEILMLADVLLKSKNKVKDTEIKRLEEDVEWWKLANTRYLMLRAMINLKKGFDIKGNISLINKYIKRINNNNRMYSTISEIPQASLATNPERKYIRKIMREFDK
jgi:hypothetical protein